MDDTVVRDKIKLLVVDDHALVREGVRHTVGALSPKVQIFEARNAEEAEQIVEREPDLDLVLLDLGLPGTSGFKVLTQLHERSASLPVVVLSASDDRPDVVNALNGGAVGFIPKSCTRELMLHAIRLVLAGGIYIPPQAMGLLNGSATSGLPRQTQPGLDRAQGLTHRQLAVLELLAQGKPNKIIAADLQISEATVKAHVTQILRALRVTNRAQALVAARRLGYGPS